MSKEFKITQLVPGVLYVVVNLPYGSTLRRGDKVKIEPDGSMLCFNAGGWLEESAWKKLSRVRLQVDTESIYKRAMKTRKEYEALMDVYRTYT